MVTHAGTPAAPACWWPILRGAPCLEPCSAQSLPTPEPGTSWSPVNTCCLNLCEDRCHGKGGPGGSLGTPGGCDNRRVRAPHSPRPTTQDFWGGTRTWAWSAPRVCHLSIPISALRMQLCWSLCSSEPPAGVTLTQGGRSHLRPDLQVVEICRTTLGKRHLWVVSQLEEEEEEGGGTGSKWCV